MDICTVKWGILLCILLQISNPVTSLITQDLGGNWAVKNKEHGYDLPAAVPGGIYSDLMHNNIIGDVFYGFNDLNTRWVSKLNWNYSRSFSVDEDFLAHDNINLVFDGVDTFAKVVINDVEIGSTENMFVRYIFDIKPHVNLGNNHIEVQFQSPVNTAQLLFDEQAKKYQVPPLCVPKKYNGECHANHVRKMQASFSWDWGPAFPSVGIWKQVYLEAYNSTVLRDVTTDISLDQKINRWDVQLNVYLAESSTSNSIQGTLLVKVSTEIEHIVEIYRVSVAKNENGDFLTTHNLSIPESYVRLWWPNGYGKSTLYTLDVAFINSEETEESHTTLRIGFRTVELVQNIIDSGRTFYFKVNDVPIFAKGSNSIPLNILPEVGQNQSTVKFLLESARDVHMNMLRVWGGGVYESDTFYELADEMGILIWQDFMFACSMYPTNDDFLRTVREEVKHQVRRLQHHPSIILWSGNNENEAALRQNWYGTKKNFSLYQNDFKKLYVDTIRKEVLLNDDTRPFLTSSPTNGKKSEEEDYIATNPQSHFYGDVHYYNYILDSWKGSTYPVNRFASEYGYQSLPCIETLLSATNNITDLDIDSPFLTSRQHRPLGYFEIQLLIGYQLKLPSEGSENFYKAYIFYSQIMQAMAIKIETEYYRQWRSNLNKKGEGLTMGALYWQLNDVWVAPSWSGIDFKNNWKMLHYYAKNFFAPVIITGDLTAAKKLNLYIVSDLTKPIFNATVTIGVFRWDSFVPVHQHIIKTDVLPSISHQIETYDVDKLLSKIRSAPCGEEAIQNCFIYLTLIDSTNKTIAPDNFVFPSRLKSANLTIPTIKISNIEQVDNTAKTFIIKIKTSAIALFVWLDGHGIPGRFSDNGFLQVTEEKTVQFYSEHRIKITKLVKTLTVTNLLADEYL